MTNVLSEKVSRENGDSRSSFDSMEKNNRNSANVTMPMVRAMASPCTWSAQCRLSPVSADSPTSILNFSISLVIYNQL